MCVADLTNIFNGPWITPPPRIDPPEEQLIEAIADAGLEPPEQVFLDGKIHRFRSGQKKDKTGWYVVFGDGIPAGRFGDWREDISQPWTADIGRQLTYDEVEARKRHIEEAKRIRDQEIEKLHDAVALAAQRIWDGGTPATAEHPYLKRKGVQPHGIKVSGEGKLMVPACTMDGDIKTIQYIDADGKKQFHQGGEAGGNVYFLGDESESPIYIAEGFATAATIHEVTGKPVVVAFSCHNLVEATGKVRDKRGALSEIVVVADNDESGMGEKMARRACEKHGARFVMPPDVGDDVNDYFQKGGDVRTLLAPPLEGWLISVKDFATVPAPIPWLIKGWIPANALCMVHGPSGCGKTFVVLNWCMGIACSDSMVAWEGLPTKRGMVVYLAGEGHHGLRARVAAWLKYYEVKPDDVDLFISASGCDLNTPEGYLKVKSHIDAIGRKPVLIVVDTLHRFLSGDENSAQDAKIMVDACAGLQYEYGCSVLLVHHTGVSDEAQHRARGSSAWKGALNMELSVAMRPNKEDLQLICRKMKDGAEPEPVWVRLQKGVEIPGWFDDEGEPVTSAVIVKGEEPCETKQDKNKMSDSDQLGIKTFRTAASTFGQVKDGRFDGVSIEAWRREFYRVYPADEEDEAKATQNKKKAFYRVRLSLLKNEHIRVSEDGKFVFPGGSLAGVDEQIFVSSIKSNRNDEL